MEIFLTFLIITYRRPDKVARLLQTFLDDRWHQLDDLKFEIVIADDHSEDNTGSLIKPIIEALQIKGWSVRYVYRDTNLRGDRNLYYGYTRDSIGKFVWFLCDDDMINVSEAIKYIFFVYETDPLVSICGFTQGEKNQIGNNFGGEARIITDFQEAVDCLIKFPKTTAYLLRRFKEINLDTIFERWDNTLTSWIGISIFLLAKNKNKGLLIYPKTVATGDDDYSLLQYSFRVFRYVYIVTKDSIEISGENFQLISLGLKNLKEEDELTLNLIGLGTHHTWRAPIRYTQKVYNEELAFLKKNWPLIFHTRRRVIHFILLIIYRTYSFFK